MEDGARCTSGKPSADRRLPGRTIGCIVSAILVITREELTHVPRKRRILWSSLATLVTLALVATGAVYLRSEGMLRRVYAVPPHDIPIPTDSASIARGAHLVNAVGTLVR